MDPYELAPQEDGTWNVQHGGETVAEGLESRAEALKAAQEARGDKLEQLFDAEGEPALEHHERGGPEAIHLLRVDGSLYGELDHELGGGEGQEVELEAAGEEAEA